MSRLPTFARNIRFFRGIPEFFRSDNGPEFVTKAVREWIAAVGAKTDYTKPGSPWENGYV
jgi:putative transposase